MAQVKIHRDGSVETLCGTQDIGGGARTVVLLHTSRYLNYLPLEKITVRIGDSDFGTSGASAGSSTTRAVDWEVKRAIKSVLKLLFEEVSGKLGVAAGEMKLEKGGRIQAGDKLLDWDRACALLRDTVISYAPTLVEPDAQWAVLRDDGSIEQASEEDYRS